jgi:putative DNA primase/helicase
LEATEAQSSDRARAEAEEFLKGILGNGPVPSKDIQNEAKEAGLAWATVRRTKTRLRIKAQKTGMDGGWVWVLPKMLTSTEDAPFQK